ncbi:sensor histidine kinase [Nonomuraea sp. NPDC050451]|uniref:sensor histidine kinase n=1 Tax=Nonomuraea sp. NPDC050451 TaxID=3364364 RepID=UPI0037BCEC7F
MRTPITILNGQIEGMADGIFTPEDAMFASLTDDLTRLRRLTDDLSNLSRAEEGASSLQHSLTDVTALTRTTVEKLRPQFDDGQVTLAMTPGPPVKALLDSGRIAQVLVNLLGNALRACDPGDRVSVTVRTGDGPAPHVEITVQDDGLGIAAHDLTRIFTRFERVEHPGRPAPAGGSGIGLTIARGITRTHGGDITASSEGPWGDLHRPPGAAKHLAILWPRVSLGAAGVGGDHHAEGCLDRSHGDSAACMGTMSSSRLKIASRVKVTPTPSAMARRRSAGRRRPTV